MPRRQYPQHKEILSYMEEKGLSYREMGDMLDCSAQTLHSFINREGKNVTLDILNRFRKLQPVTSEDEWE